MFNTLGWNGHSDAGAREAYIRYFSVGLNPSKVEVVCILLATVTNCLNVQTVQCSSRIGLRKQLPVHSGTISIRLTT